MVGALERTVPSTDRSAAWWLQLLVRVGLVWLVVGPAVSKFLTYSRSVAFFAELGVPAPAAMVLLAGVVEVAAVLLLALGVADDLAALALVPVMGVAMLYAGPDWKNLAVVAGCLALLALRRERVRGRYRRAAGAVSRR